MEFKYLQEVIALVEILLVQKGGEVIPCTSAEVEAIESMLPSPYRLPLAYKEFLLYAGQKISHYFGHVDSPYRSAKVLLQNNYQYISYYTPCPPNLFVIEEQWKSYFTYLFLTEGENPPVYWWREGKLGLEAPRQINDSFTDYLKEKVEIATESKHLFNRNRIKAGKPPRGEQLCFYALSGALGNRANGLTRKNIMYYLGFDSECFSDLEQAAAIIGVDPDSYLEELSGWKKRPVTKDGKTTILFFPLET